MNTSASRSAVELEPADEAHRILSEAAPYEHQIGGSHRHHHHASFQDSKQCQDDAASSSSSSSCSSSSSSRLLSWHNCVLKPVQLGLRGHIEESFYRHVQSNASQFPILHSFLPHYYRSISTSSSSSLYLQLEDVTHGFQRPCIMDIKIGRITADEEATPEKRLTEQNKCPYQTQLGLRIVGSKRYAPFSSSSSSSFSDYIHMNKYEARLLPAHDFQQVMETFLSSSASPIFVARTFLSRLLLLEKWFKTQRDFRFYSSSILLVYEGSVSSLSSSSSDENLPPSLYPFWNSYSSPSSPHHRTHTINGKTVSSSSPSPRVAMIDFGHVFGKHRQSWLQSLENDSKEGPRAEDNIKTNSRRREKLEVKMESEEEEREKEEEQKGKYETLTSAIDENYLFGLRTLNQTLQCFIAKAEQAEQEERIRSTLKAKLASSPSPSSLPTALFCVQNVALLVAGAAVGVTVHSPAVIQQLTAIFVSALSSLTIISSNLSLEVSTSFRTDFASATLFLLFALVLAVVCMFFFCSFLHRPYLYTRLLSSSQRDRAHLRSLHPTVPGPFFGWYELCSQQEFDAVIPNQTTGKRSCFLPLLQRQFVLFEEGEEEERRERKEKGNQEMCKEERRKKWRLECVDAITNQHYPVECVNHLIFVWIPPFCSSSCSDQVFKPQWHVPQIKDIDEWNFAGRTTHECVAFAGEIAENGADEQHFTTIHGNSILPVLSSCSALKHCWKTTWIPRDKKKGIIAYSRGTTETSKREEDEEGQEDGEGGHLVDLTIEAETRLFGYLLSGTQVKTKVLQVGVGIAHVHFHFTPLRPLPLVRILRSFLHSFCGSLFLPILGGEAVMIETITPLSPSLQLARHTFYSSSTLSYQLAQFLLYNAVHQFEQDEVIWSNKRYLRTPCFGKNDATLLKFRRWLKKFEITKDLS